MDYALDWSCCVLFRFVFAASTGLDLRTTTTPIRPSGASEAASSSASARFVKTIDVAISSTSLPTFLYICELLIIRFLFCYRTRTRRKKKRRRRAEKWSNRTSLCQSATRIRSHATFAPSRLLTKLHCAARVSQLVRLSFSFFLLLLLLLLLCWNLDWVGTDWVC